MRHPSKAQLRLIAIIAMSSAADVARRTGIQAVTVSRLASGEHEPRASTIRACTVLGITADDWITAPTADEAQ